MGCIDRVKRSVRKDTMQESSPFRDKYNQPSDAIPIEINGTLHHLAVEHRTTLLEVLRDHLDLTGAKRACDRGECGACTVLIDGRPMVACQLLAVQVRDRQVVTIEGLVEQDDFKPLLDAFVAHDGGQCGFCIPGFAVAAYAALQQQKASSPMHIRWELVGHICRCNAYENIVAAVDAARQQGVHKEGDA